MKLEETEFIQKSIRDPDTHEYIGEEFTGQLCAIAKFMITEEAYARELDEMQYKMGKRKAIEYLITFLEKQAIEQFSGGQQLPDGTPVYVSRHIEGKLIIVDPVTYTKEMVIR